MSDRAKAYLIIVVVIAVGFGGFRLWETYSPQGEGPNRS